MHLWSLCPKNQRRVFNGLTRDTESLAKLVCALQLKDLQPASPGKRGAVTLTAVIITTLMYLLISLGSYVVFGASVKADVLQNFSVHRLQSILPVWFSWVVSFVARLSFLLGVMTLYPLMVSSQHQCGLAAYSSCSCWQARSQGASLGCLFCHSVSPDPVAV